MRSARSVAILPLLLLVAAAPATGPATRSTTVRIILAGDSTVTQSAGWGGAPFAASFGDKVQVINLAQGGRSSKSYRDEGWWDKVLAAKPDHVVIQFGHNDQPGKGPKRQTDPNTTFHRNMARYVDEARAAGAKPILVTSLARREWGEGNQSIRSSLLPYVEAVKAVAAEKNVPLVDLHARSIEVYLSLGREGCEEFISPTKKDGPGYDGTHLNDVGRAVFGPLMGDALRQAVPELRPLRASYKPPTERPRISTRPSSAASATAPSEASASRLPSPQGQRTLTVAVDGSGDFRRVQDALAAVPDSNADRTTIRIRPGVYFGQIVVPKSKTNVTFLGDDAATTILTYSLNVQDPIPATELAWASGTGVVVLGDGFRAEHLTFRNTSGDHGQAMALRLQTDRAVLRDCHLLGWQDTLLVHSGRHYFKDCYIEGRVDFIYGGGTDVFDGCEIHSKQGGYVTAASTPEDHPFGFVFLHCRLTSDDNTPTYLGRPWRPFASVAYINCEMGAHIRPEGWHNWGKESNEKTARYAEFNSTGPGAAPDKRVAWSRQLNKHEAEKITVQSVLGAGDGWDPTH